MVNLTNLLMLIHCRAAGKGHSSSVSQCGPLTLCSDLSVTIIHDLHCVVFFFLFFYPDRRGLNGLNFLSIGMGCDESCVTHSLPQVGVDNLDQHAHSF